MDDLDKKLKVAANRRLLLGASLIVTPPSLYGLIVDLNSIEVSGWISWPLLAVWMYFIITYIFPKNMNDLV